MRTVLVLKKDKPSVKSKNLIIGKDPRSMDSQTYCVMLSDCDNIRAVHKCDV